MNKKEYSSQQINYQGYLVKDQDGGVIIEWDDGITHRISIERIMSRSLFNKFKIKDNEDLPVEIYQRKDGFLIRYKDNETISETFIPNKENIKNKFKLGLIALSIASCGILFSCNQIQESLDKFIK